MKVLIIDDNAGVRMSLKLVLSGVFEEIVSVGDPQLIPALLNAGNIDAVLLDMNFGSERLDGSDGIFWLSRIKECGNPPAVIMITAFGDVALAVEAMKLGAEDFITKPWDNAELISKVKRAISRNRQDKVASDAVENAKDIVKREDLRSRMTLDEVRLLHVNEVISQCGGNLSAAAEKLGINRQTLYNILKKK